MPGSERRKYFIVKHGLDALEKLPEYIWRTGKGQSDRPRGYDKIAKRDQWIGYAFTDSDRRTRALSHVTGFYECTEEARYMDIPPQALTISDGETKAWMIKGRRVGRKLAQHIFMPGIEKVLREANLLPKKLVPRVSVVEISHDQFDAIREYVLEHTDNPKNIPLDYPSSN